MQFSLRLCGRDSVFQPSEYAQVERAPRIDRIPALEGNWNDELGIAIGKAYSSRHDPDDAPRDAVNPDGLPDHIRIQSKALLPVAVAQHHHGIATRDSFIPSKETAHGRVNAE